MFLKYLLFFIFTISLFVTQATIAAYPTTDQDFSFLPPFCKAKLKPASPAETELWGKRLGYDFGHTHHYCAALHSVRIAQSINPTNADQKQDRDGLFRSAIGDIQYMEDKAKPSYILFPHIYTTKAEALFGLNNNGEAVNYLYKAIDTNKKYGKSYALLADYLIKNGKKDEAKDILLKGLKYSPNSKLLKRKLQKLK